MPYKRPVPGDAVRPYVGRADLWANIVNMLGEWQSGLLTNPPAGIGSTLRSGIRLTNNTDDEVWERGTARVVQVFRGLPDPTPEELDFILRTTEQPVVELSAPAKWETDLAYDDEEIVILPKTLNPRESIVIAPRRFMAVKCRYPLDDPSDPSSDIFPDLHKYVTLDPQNPGQFLANRTSGLYQIIGFMPQPIAFVPNIPTGLAVIDTAKNQRVFGFKQLKDEITGSIFGPYWEVDIYDLFGNKLFLDTEEPWRLTSGLLGDDAMPGKDNFGQCMLVNGSFILTGGGGGTDAKILKTPQDGIAKRNETTGEVTFEECVEYELSGLTLQPKSPEVKTEVGNPFLGDVCGDVIILATSIDGDWLVEAEDCVCEEEEPAGPVNP